MPTKTQIQLIQIARRQIGLDESAYRMLLDNVAGVRSCKDLTNVGVEDVMAVMEDMGFRTRNEADDYWRFKVTQRGQYCNSRVAWKIHALCAQTDYKSSGLAERHSHGRTNRVEELEDDEAYEVIEALKSIILRNGGTQCLGEFTRGKPAEPAVTEEMPF